MCALFEIDCHDQSNKGIVAYFSDGRLITSLDDRKVMVKSSQAVARATDYLLSRQNPSGGWGSVALNAQVIVSLRLASGINMARIK